MHRRSLLLALAVALSLLTALTLLQLQAVLTADGGTTSIGAARAAVDVRAFYDAVNAALRTGDPTPLDALIAPAFVDHQLSADRPLDRATFEHHLLALQATYPDLRFTVEDLSADGTRVTARVAARGTQRTSVLGISLGGHAAIWHTIEVFRLVSGLVVEHWGGAEPASLLQPLLKATIPRVPQPSVLVLARLTFAPGAQHSVSGFPGTLLLANEEGMLAVRGTNIGPLDRGPVDEPTPTLSAASPTSKIAMLPGDRITFPPGAIFELHNTGQTPAMTLAVALLPPDSPQLWAAVLGHNDEPTTGGVLALTMILPPSVAPPPPRGIGVQRLAEGVVPAETVGPAVVAVGRAVLPPWTTLPPHRVSTMELLAVEDGTLAPMPDGGAVTPGVGDTAAAPATTETVATTASPKAVCLSPGTTSTIGAAGGSSLVVLIVTLMPQASTSPSTSSESPAASSCAVSPPTPSDIARGRR